MSQRHHLVAVCVFCVVLFVSFAPPVAASFCENWGNGTTGWTVSGAGAAVDCNVGYPIKGCSLALQPPPVGTYTTVTRDPDALVDQLTTLTFQFMASGTPSNTDTAVDVELSNGGVVQLHLTDGQWLANQGLLLISTGHGSSSFGSWDTSATWHRGTIFIDPGTCKTWAEVETFAGAIMTSAQLGIPCTGLNPSITAVTLRGVSWGDPTSSFWYDAICLLD